MKEKVRVNMTIQQVFKKLQEGPWFSLERSIEKYSQLIQYTDETSQAIYKVFKWNLCQDPYR